MKLRISLEGQSYDVEVSFCRKTQETAPLRSRLGNAAMIPRDLLLSRDRKGAVLPLRVGVSRQKPAAARQWLASSFAKAVEFLRSRSPEELALPLPAGPVMGGQPIGDIVWSMVEHTAHHRGALTVYSRLLGKVPAMPYGG
jgi:hypothetical protein